MSKMIKFTQSGFYNIRGNPTDVKHMEFPLIEDWKHGSCLLYTSPSPRERG